MTDEEQRRMVAVFGPFLGGSTQTARKVVSHVDLILDLNEAIYFAGPDGSFQNRGAWCKAQLDERSLEMGVLFWRK